MISIRVLLRWFALILFLPSTLHAELSAELIASDWQQIPHGEARFIQISSGSSSIPPWGLEVKLEKDWHTYWRNPGDSGAELDIYGIQGELENKLAIHYPFPERMNVGPLTTYGYSDHTLYFFDDENQRYQKLVADLLVCKEECIPGTIEVGLGTLRDLGTEEDTELKQFISLKLAQLPQGLPILAQQLIGHLDSKWQIYLPSGAEIVDLFWFPEQSGSLEKLNFATEGDSVFHFYTPQSASRIERPKALVVFEQNNVKQSAVVEFETVAASIWPFVFGAILGGLILNLMPCVFPIVSLKAFSVASASGKILAHIRRDNLFYCFGVIVCFIALALLIVALRASGQFVGWGFQLQNVGFVSFLAVLFLIMGLSFFDIWSWRHVPGFATVGSQGSGPTSSFFTGLLAVVVASPCTAPFMGAAIGFALAQSVSVIFAVFLGLGFGMALPFFLLALFPSFSRFLPKPGNWMVTFKKAMGGLLLLTSAYLIWLGFQLVLPDGTVDESKWHSLQIEQWEQMEATPEAKLINFTADWCITCKVNERVVFANQKVEDYFAAQNIKLFKVDWTKRESNIAAKLAEYGRAGVPMYLYYPAGSNAPRVLPEVITPDSLIERLK